MNDTVRQQRALGRQRRTDRRAASRENRATDTPELSTPEATLEPAVSGFSGNGQFFGDQPDIIYGNPPRLQEGLGNGTRAICLGSTSAEDAAEPIMGAELSPLEPLGENENAVIPLGEEQTGRQAVSAVPAQRRESEENPHPPESPPGPAAEETETDQNPDKATENQAREEEVVAEELLTEAPAEEPEPPPENAVVSGAGGAPAEAERDAGDANPRAIVQRWRGGVSRSAQTVPSPSMAQVASEPARLGTAAESANQSRRRQRQRLPEEAAANISASPRVETPPPTPPASNPVPEHTSRIEQQSGRRLRTQHLPTLERTPRREVTPQLTVGGNLPRLGQGPVSRELFQLLITQGAERLAQIPDNERNRERQRLQEARRALEAPLEVNEQAGDGEAVPLVDSGPEQIRPLPEQQATPVAQVVARLLASMETSTSNVLIRLRRLAYPRGVLATEYPDIGQELGSQVRPRMNTDLREIATSAGIGGEELDTMIARCQNKLQDEVEEIDSTITQANEAATEDLSEGGQEMLDAIAGARNATDEEIINRQEQASGGNDPTVINARRDLIIRWIRERVTTQTTNYQKAGEKRARELTTGETQRVNAYNALAQREEYQILHPRPPTAPHNRTDSDVERNLQNVTAAVRNWTRERVTGVQNTIRGLKRTASQTTRDNRSAIETAGNDGISAARTWAEDRILEGQSWWKRFKARISRWFGDSQQVNEQWAVRRTEETRNGIVRDLTAIEYIQEAVRNGATEEQLLQQENLTTEQQDIIREFFAQPRGGHPLDIAAGALRQRLARQYLTIARPVFERELIAKPDTDHEKLNNVARAIRSSFDGAQIAQDIHAQLDLFNTDEAAVLRSLEGLSALEGAIVRKVYRARYRRSLDMHMREAFNSDEMNQAQLRLQGRQAAADATALHDAMGIINTDESAIMDLLRGRSPTEIDAIRIQYRALYGDNLDAALEGDLDEGNEQDQANALLSGDRATADAIALDEAMRGGWISWGTDEEEIESTYERVRSEVLAQARSQGWNSQQMEAEIRRRTQAIEARFNTRYANVEEYQAPGLAGDSVLRRAISSEMDPGPERDLANALASNELASADAARIEIEHRSVYASDETINNVLRNQYERSLQATRLDQGPARRMRVDRLRREMQDRDPPPTEEEMSVEVIRMERQMESEMADEAQTRSRVSMQAIEQAYDDSYTFPLWYTIETNMSGSERERARDLRHQGGRLTPLQEVEYATGGAGTDEDALRTQVGSMTRSQIAELRRQWEARHPGESFNDMLRGELSGRDESDIMDMVEHGAPESASARIAQERRRTQRELDDLTGWLGGLAAGNEEQWLRDQQARLNELEPQLHRRDLSPEQRRRLRDDLDLRVERVQQAVTDHRRALDSVTNTATQIAGLAVAITVGAVLTAVSGGTLGPVMIAVIASVAATLTTMGTKALIQGGAYGGEDIGIDLAVGVVDAVTAAATAGMGGRILRGASGAAQQAAQPTRLTQVLGRAGRSGVARRVGRSRAGQAVGRATSRANRAQSGFMTPGIQGQNPLARMAQGDNRAMRLFAEALAEGIENAAGALPSSLTQTALTDETWQGNPFLNLLEGTAMGVGMGVAMGGAMQGVRGVAGSVRSGIRLSTPEGRVREANRMLGDAFQRHRQQHPDSSYADFLAHPDGQRAHAEVEQRGLIQPGEAPSTPAATEVGAPPAAGRETPAAAVPPETTAPARSAETRPTPESTTTPKTAPEASTARAEAEPTTPVSGRETPSAAVPPEAPATTRPGETSPILEPKAAPEVAPEAPTVRTEAEPATPTAKAEADTAMPRMPEEAVESPSRRATEDEGETPRTPTVDPTSQALRDGLPSRLTDSADVRVNPDLEGNTVRVIPDAEGGPRHGIRVEAGPDARPVDVMMHAHTVQSMQRYSGLLGRLRTLRDWFNLTSVGSRGWEAKLELEKLPGIIHERMQHLSQGDLDPAAQTRLVDEINHLSNQIDTHQRVLESPSLRDEAGRGYVAAAGQRPKIVSGVSRTIPPRTQENMLSLPRQIIHNSPLQKEFGTVYQIGERWQYRGRVYRRVVVLDAEGGVARVREEIQGINAKTSRRENRWVQRGSESQGKIGKGAVGEEASRISIEEGLLPPEVGGIERVNIPSGLLRNASDNGFDGAFLRLDPDGGATIVVVEAKNQPSGLSLDSFSAIRGARLKENLDGLWDTLTNTALKKLGMTETQRDTALAALRGKNRRIEIQVHTTPDTPLGARGNPRSSILKNLEAEANATEGLKTANIQVRHVPLSEPVTDHARRTILERDRIGEPSVRLQALAGEGAMPTSIEHHQAQSVLMAEGVFTNGLVSPNGQGQFIDQSGVSFEVMTPGFHGASPSAADVADDVLTRLRAPSPLNAGGPRRVILDLDNLPADKQLQVQQLLARETDAADLFEHLLIHDRENAELVTFDPAQVE